MLERNYRCSPGRRRLKGKFAAGRTEGLAALAANAEVNNSRWSGTTRSSTR